MDGIPVQISGGIVYATGGDYAAAIGGGYHASGGATTIVGNNVTLYQGVTLGAKNFTYGDDGLPLDIPRHRVMWDGDEIALTNREFMMLQTLLENRGIVLSRDVLLSKVCGYDYVGETNVIDVYVRYLRTKIDEVYDVKMIRTVRGVGYVIDG